MDIPENQSVPETNRQSVITQERDTTKMMTAENGKTEAIEG